jgi:hypothetical protein
MEDITFAIDFYDEPDTFETAEAFELEPFLCAARCARGTDPRVLAQVRAGLR